MIAAARAQQSSFVPDWVKDAVFYEIFPERFANGSTANDPPNTEPWGGEPTPRNYFGGDLEGIIQHMDYITALGVNTLYLTPIFESTSNHKYHTKSYLNIDPHFGDDATFKRLVDSCHTRGIRIILDAVFNHTGVDFFAFEDIKKNGARSAYLGWYNIYSLPIGPPTRPNYECWWGMGDLPKLMTTNPDVQNHLFEATRHWMEFGIDGWRLDVPNEVPHQFWIKWRALVKSINPGAYILGEIWDDARPWLKGDQFDAVMNYRFRKACIDFFVKGTVSVARFDSTLSKQRLEYPGDVNFVLQNLLGSHDTERFLTLCDGNVDLMKLAVLFQMTYLGAPMVYYGDEVGMTGRKDPGSRRTMVWDTSKQNAELLEFFRSIIALRNSSIALRRGSFEAVRVDSARKVYIFVRRHARQTATVVVNAGSKPAQLSIPVQGVDKELSWRQVWPANRKPNYRHVRAINVVVPPTGAAIFFGEKKQ